MPLLLVAWLGSFSFCLAAPGRILDIRSHVLATGPQVRLEEFAADPASLTREQRDEVVVSRAPARGEVQHLTLIDLAYRLQRCPGLLDINLRGPSRIAIQGGGDPAFLRRCQKDLTKQLQATAPWDAWRISVRLGLDDERRLADASHEYATITLRPRDSSLLLGSVALDVVFADAAGETLSECTLSPTILREVKVLMTIEGLERGHTLRAVDLRETSVWLGDAPQRHVTDLATAVGSELSRRLGPGELLLHSHLTPPMCAQRGEIIRVRIQSASMTIAMNAQALDPGRLGDTVRLRNPTSEAIFRAALTGRKQALFATQ